MRLERSGLKTRAHRDCAPLALIVDENRFERSGFALNGLSGVLIEPGVDHDPHVAKRRVKLAGDKFFALVVMGLEPVGGKCAFHGRCSYGA